MAALIEGISAVIRIDAITAWDPGGWKVFNANAPSASCCRDGELARVGFKASWNTKAFLEALERLGLNSTVDGMAHDTVAGDRLQGSATVCVWIEGARAGLQDDAKRLEWVSC